MLCVASMHRACNGCRFQAEPQIVNQHEALAVVRHGQRPVLVDAEKGLLLWPLELAGRLECPMPQLHAYPFDRAVVQLHIHQNENSSRDVYVFRPFDDAEEEPHSVRFFFDLFEDLKEFDAVGFSRECYETLGGNLEEYSQCKVSHLEFPFLMGIASCAAPFPHMAGLAAPRPSVGAAAVAGGAAGHAVHAALALRPPRPSLHRRGAGRARLPRRCRRAERAHRHRHPHVRRVERAAAARGTEPAAGAAWPSARARSPSSFVSLR
jgi:hypothetical protein